MSDPQHAVSDPTIARRTLSRAITPPDLTPALLDLPERAIQFGTGAFLRGFVDYFLDAANRLGQFNGRIVAVGSTGSGGHRAFSDQNGMYTLVSRGLVHGVPRETRHVINSVSRALSAVDEWQAVLACARNPQLALIFSNTTEVGIALDDTDRSDASPPRSFPAKLTRFLHERATAFAFAPSKGVIVIPCELIENNGAQLQRLVRELAVRWQLEPGFLKWLDRSVTFCNTLVDRIVPGAPVGDEREQLLDSLGYGDALLTIAEHFRQFVIEGDETLRSRLGFAAADDGIIVARDIEPYRRRKVSLLNGAHTLSVSTALLCGCETVHDAMQHPSIGRFIEHALLHDIVPTLDVPKAREFAISVLERFGNPFIRHALSDITLHGTTKFRVRLVPTIVRSAQRMGSVSSTLVFGFAAHVLFLRGDLQARRKRDGQQVPPDARGAQITERWRSSGIVTGTTTELTAADCAKLRNMVERTAADEELWGVNLNALPTFVDAVTLQLSRMLTHGVEGALASMLNSTPTARAS